MCFLCGTILNLRWFMKGGTRPVQCCKECCNTKTGFVWSEGLRRKPG